MSVSIFCLKHCAQRLAIKRVRLKSDSLCMLLSKVNCTFSKRACNTFVSVLSFSTILLLESLTLFINYDFPTTVCRPVYFIRFSVPILFPSYLVK